MKKIFLLITFLITVIMFACGKNNGAFELQIVEAKDCFDNAGFYHIKTDFDGEYTFKAEGKNNLVWDIYVLDNEWDDAPRYIPQANEKKGSTEITLKIAKGKHIYAYCPINGFTNDKTVDDRLLVIRKQ